MSREQYQNMSCIHNCQHSSICTFFRTYSHAKSQHTNLCMDKLCRFRHRDLFGLVYCIALSTSMTLDSHHSCMGNFQPVNYIPDIPGIRRQSFVNRCHNLHHRSLNIFFLKKKVFFLLSKGMDFCCGYCYCLLLRVPMWKEAISSKLFLISFFAVSMELSH